jgi:formylmethanofuran dehydrogenase subunit E
MAVLNNEEFLQLVEKVFAFHTKRAPGIAVSVEMVNQAKEHLGDVDKLCAITETRACMPDAIQYILGCTIGNGNLKVLESIGRFALTLYDRKTGKGVRIFVDQNKIDKEKYSELYKFFRRERSEAVKNFGPERKVSNAQVIKELVDCGRNIFTMEDVIVKNTKKPPMLDCGICEKCGESYTKEKHDDKLCQYCSGKMNYYDKE